MSDLQPKLGLLPNDGSRPFLRIELPPVALTTPPAAVDWFSKLTVPLGMYGNDQVGDCVVAAIIHDYLVSWCATHPGQKPPVIPTTQDALNFYWSINTDHVDRGLVIQTALEKLLANGICGVKPLAFATVDLSVTNLRAVTGFFVSAILGVEVDQAQYYPAKLWDYVPGSLALGGHGISTGALSSNPDRAAIATWGYIAQMTDDYINHKVGEVDVIIWPWVYDALPTETADKLAADFRALTGRTLPPQVLPPNPSPKVYTAHVPAGPINLFAVRGELITARRSSVTIASTSLCTAPRSYKTAPGWTIDGRAMRKPSSATLVQLASGPLAGLWITLAAAHVTKS